MKEQAHFVRLLKEMRSLSPNRDMTVITPVNVICAMEGEFPYRQ